MRRGIREHSQRSLAGPALVGLALVGLALVGLALVGLALVGLALVGLAPVGLAPAGAAAAARRPGGSGPAGPAVRAAGTVEPGFPVAWQTVRDLDSDGRAELLVVGRGGEVRTWRFDPDLGRFPAQGSGRLVLPDPDASLFDLGDILEEGGGVQLVVASPAGVRLYRLGADGGFDPGGILASDRAVFRIRVGRPTKADLLSDLNGDGHLDLTLPAFETMELWTRVARRGGGEQAPRLSFRKSATIPVDVNRSRATDTGAISGELVASLVLPRLRIEDVNGDGRADLIVEDGDRRAFHVQTEEGLLPPRPDVVLDLSIFRDTTPRAEVRLGRTFAGSDDPQFHMTDLDGDGIPDYLIHHRRKVWIFHGSGKAPQFRKPTTILKVANDISALLVTPLDDDSYPDLLLLRLDLPTVAALMRGLFTEWDVDVSAVAFAGTGGGKSFEGKPHWKSDLVLRLPSILGILRNPEELLERIEAGARQFRPSVEGDFDGAGGEDVALVSVDEKTLEFWFGEGMENLDDVERRGGRLLRRILFEEQDRVWDVERILSLLGGIADQYVALMTGARTPDARIALRKGDRFARTGLFPGDVDGDGRCEIAVAYRDLESGSVLFDLLEIE